MIGDKARKPNLANQKPMSLSDPQLTVIILVAVDPIRKILAVSTKRLKSKDRSVIES